MVEKQNKQKAAQCTHEQSTMEKRPYPMEVTSSKSKVMEGGSRSSLKTEFIESLSIEVVS